MKENNINQSEIETLRLYSEDDILEDEEFQKVTVGISSVLGTRKTQQDSVYGNFQNGNGIGIVCDGMGGLQGGEKASYTAVAVLAGDYQETQGRIEDIPTFLKQEVRKADNEVAKLCDQNGALLDAGTTLVSVIIQDDKLYWISVGDSKIYIMRNDEIVCVNRLHNYRMTMDEMLRKGDLTPEEYQKREKQAEALISYVGMGGVSLMDISPEGFQLRDGDKVLLASDGLYRLLPDQVILNIVKKHMFDMQNAAKALTDEATSRRISAQDNTSVVLIHYRDEIK